MGAEYIKLARRPRIRIRSRRFQSAAISVLHHADSDFFLGAFLLVLGRPHRKPLACFKKSATVFNPRTELQRISEVTPVRQSGWCMGRMCRPIRNREARNGSFVLQCFPSRLANRSQNIDKEFKRLEPLQAYLELNS